MKKIQNALKKYIVKELEIDVNDDTIQWGVDTENEYGYFWNFTYNDIDYQVGYRKDNGKVYHRVA